MALSLSVSLSLPRCSNHGQCRVAGEAQWECRCYEGWDGPDCGVPLEQNCADNKDNDKGDATLSPTPLGSIFIAQIYWNRDSCTLPLQTAWWTARTRNAAKTRPVAWANCAWAHPSQLTFSCASNRPLSPPLSSSAWNSSSTRAACRTMLAWRRSTKGMLCRQSIAHKFSVCDSNFTALGGSASGGGGGEGCDEGVVNMKMKRMRNWSPNGDASYFKFCAAHVEIYWQFGEKIGYCKFQQFILLLL